MLPFDNPESWNRKVRSHLPLTFKAAELGLAGVSRTQMSDPQGRLRRQELPSPEHGSMCYM